NVTNLSLNSVMVYVNRSLDKLSTFNRPLSKSVGVENLYNQRKEIYQNAKDIEITNNGEVSSAVKETIKAYETACNKWC
ncbi:MAG: shikimate dehydrogenase, partial [Clostridia bacterium]|nr:shikimate dehydrogenase [Clostridia bacterium]